MKKRLMTVGAQTTKSFPLSKLSLSSIGQLRLASQRLLGSVFAQPVEAVRWMLAMQAQDFPGAKWSIGLRVPGTTDAEVEAALARREIVRSWPMRGTLHFTAAEDLPWLLELTTPRLIRGAEARRAALQLDDARLERAREIVIEQLSGNRMLTRKELLLALNRGGISTEAQRGYHILWHLSQTGTLCFGAPVGNEQTFVLLSEWILRPRKLAREEALGELARRYFTSHGPATVVDLARWVNLPLKECTLGLTMARPHLLELPIEGKTYWMAADAEQLFSEPKEPLSSSVALLPGFDEYLLGYKDRDAVLLQKYATRIVPGNNGIFRPTIVTNGQVIGVWRREDKRQESLLQIEPFGELAPMAKKKLPEAGALYGRFFGLSVRVVLPAPP